MEFDLKGARAAGYSDAEIADALARELDFDLDGARKAGYKDRDIVDQLTASPSLWDYGRSLVAGALSGAGMIAQGGGELVARGVNAVAGTELRAENPLKGAAEWLEQSRSPAAQRRIAESEITGRLFELSTWDFGKNPTLSGLALQGINAIGQFAPNLAIAIGTAGASVPAQLAIGATVGGLQALGGGAEEERTRVDGMTHEQLLGASALYRELLAKGVGQGVAKDAVADAAALGGGLGNAIPSMAEGAFENFLIGALTRGKLTVPGKGIIGKAAVGAGAGVALGGTEEAVEQIGQNIGSNLAIGGTRPLTADTLQQFVMGAIAEGVVGGGGGAISGAFKEPEKPIPATPEQKIAQTVAKVQAAPTVDRAITAALEAAVERQGAIYESDIAESIFGEGIIYRAMGRAVDSAERRVREDPAYAQAEARKAAEMASIARAPVEEQADLAVALSESQAREGEPQTAMQRAWGKVVLERMEARERAKGASKPAVRPANTSATEELRAKMRENAAKLAEMSAVASEPAAAETPTIESIGNGTYVAKVGGREVGRANVADEGKADYLTSIRVEPEHRRQGIGTELYKFIEKDIGRPLRESPTHTTDDGKALRASIEPDRGATTPEVVAGLPTPKQRLFVERGRQRFEVASLEEASAKWNTFRDTTGAGASQIGEGARIVDQTGKEVARISYNGNVWPPGPYKKGQKPLVGEPYRKKTFEEINRDRIEAGVPALTEEEYNRKPQIAGEKTIDAAAHQAATSPKNELPEPSDAQKEAGNYAKGHARLAGMDLSIENPAGSKRRPEWPTLKQHYGYIRGTVGFDKDHVDVFVKPETTDDWKGIVYVVNQLKQGGKFDEHKAMIGFSSEAEARAAYLENYTAGWEKNIRSIVPMPLAYFKAWAGNKTHVGPKGGEAKPITILGKRVDQLTRKSLEVAAARAKTIAQRELAQAELDRRDAEKDARPMSEAEQKRRENLRRQALAKKRIDVDRDSLIPAIIKMGGIHVRNREDIIGDTKGNRGILGVGYLFNERGDDLDELATRLVPDGYMTQLEIDDRNDNGGVNLLTERIRDEFEGRREHWSVASDPAVRMEAAAEAEEEGQQAEDAQAAAAELGVDIDLAIGPEDLDGDPVTPENVVRDELLARLAAIDEGALERLAMQYDGRPDDEFMAAVVSFLKEHERADQRPDEAGVREGQEAGEAARVSGSDVAPPRAGEGASQAEVVRRPPTKAELEKSFEDAGRQAFLNNIPRSDVPGKGHALANESRAWLRGWDAARAETPIGSGAKPEETTAVQVMTEELGDFVSDMTPMQRGKIVDTLLKQMSSNGKVMSRAAIVRASVDAGATITQGKEGRRLSKPDGAYLGEDQIGKTAMDYAAHLIEKRGDRLSPTKAEEPRGLEVLRANGVTGKLKPNTLYILSGHWEGYTRTSGVAEQPYSGDPAKALEDFRANNPQATTQAIIATDAQGKPSKVISPNGKSVDFDSPQGRYALGDTDAFRKDAAQRIERAREEGNPDEINRAADERIADLRKRIAQTEASIARDKKEIEEDKAKQKAGVKIAERDDRFGTWREYLENRTRIVEYMTDNLAAMRKELAGWESQKVRDVRPTLELAAQTEAELKAKADAEEAAAKKKAEEEAAAEAKRTADAERGSFALTGSDRAADANPDQKALFSRRPKGDPVSKTAKTIVVDGTKRATRTSSGRLIAATKQALENFWRWFSGSATVDADGRPITLFHGTQRLDRFGTKLLPRRATSGPMPFFTDDPEIASKYATSKRDTSLAKEDVWSYEAWFRMRIPGGRSTVNLDRAWHFLTMDEREKISKLAPRVTRDDYGKIYLEAEDHTSGLGGYDWAVKEKRGNHFAALIDQWLNGATLYDEEDQFIQVLKLAGADTSQVEMHDPNAEFPGVMPVFLGIKRPLVTSEIPENVIAALERRAARSRKSPVRSGADIWDKDMRDAREWVQQLKDDLTGRKNSYVWTSIPDWVTETLRSMGYDGIRDTGGKSGGVGHDVWVPFGPTQVKSAVGNRGTFDPNSKDIRFSRGRNARISAAEAVQVLRGEFPDVEFYLAGVDLYADTTWKLYDLIVPKAMRKQGKGTAFMERLVELADEQGATLLLSPARQDDNMGTSSRGRLIDFYKRFGFVENKGRRKDYRYSDGMYRRPSEARFHRAFHGTPHDFDRFSTTAIGTGEGHQAYGWGLYFSGKKEVAEHYRKNLSGGQDQPAHVLVNGKTEQEINRMAEREFQDGLGGSATQGSLFNAKAFGELSADEVLRGLRHFDYYAQLYKDHQKGLDEAKRVAYAIAGNVEKGSVDKGSMTAQVAFAAKRLLDAGLNIEAVPEKRVGKLYQVNLAPQEEDYLDYDKRLTEQSPKVQKILRELGYLNDEPPSLEAVMERLKASPDFMYREEPEWREYRDSRGIETRELAGYKVQPMPLGHAKNFADAEYVFWETSGGGGSATWDVVKQMAEDQLRRQEDARLNRVAGIEYQRERRKAGIDMTGAELYSVIAEKFRDHYHMDHMWERLGLSPQESDERGGYISINEAASRYLDKMGIPGLKYLDGNSRTRGEGHHNYVIFDDRHVEIEAKFARSRYQPHYELDEDGPILANVDVALVQPSKWDTRGSMEMYTHMIVVDGQDVGRVSLGWEGDKVVFLPDIRLFPESRKAGTGEKVLRMLLEHNGPDAEPLIVGYITTAAEPFWRKMGVRLYDVEDGARDGAIDLEAYRVARPGQASPDGQFRRPGQGAAAALGEGQEAARADRSGAQSREVARRAASVREAVGPIIQAWGNPPEVVLIDSMADAPAAVRAQDEGQRSQGAAGAPEAFIYRNKVYLVAEGISSPAAAVRALLHESVGHFGLRGVFGDRLDGILDDVARSMAGRVRAKAREYGLDMADLEQRRQAAEEVLAELAQTMPKAGVVKRLVAAIRQFLRDLGIELELSENDIIASFILPARRFVERGRAGEASGTPALAFGRDQTASEAFEKWFGESKIVDDDGKPRVVFKAMVGDTPNMIDGLTHIAFDQETASHFGGEGKPVRAVYVKSEKPFDYRNRADTEWLVREMRKPKNVEKFNEQTRAMMGSGYDFQHDADDIQTGIEDGAYQKLEVPVVVDLIKSRGYDGIYMVEDWQGDSMPNLALFNPSQIKAVQNRGTFDPKNPDIRMERERPWYYSELERKLQDLKQGAAPVPQWKATIKALKGVSKDELEWSGVNEWLDMQSGKVTKEAVLDYLAKNGVRVEETVLGEGTESERAATSERDQLVVELDSLGYSIDTAPDTHTGEHVIDGITNRRTGWTYPVDGGGIDEVTAHVRPENLEIQNPEQYAKAPPLPDRVRDIVDRIRELELDAPTEEFSNTRYGQYTLPGGKNYRELLLTLPERPVQFVATPEQRAYFDFASEMERKHGASWRQKASIDERLKARDLEQAAKESRPRDPRSDGIVSQRQDQANFRSSHFDEPNILAHVRFNERTDAEGKRVLFLEEIQSDWAQKGKREGFSVPEEQLESVRAHDAARQRANAAYHPARRALVNNDQLGFDTVGEAADAVVSNVDWQQRWEVAQEDVASIEAYAQAERELRRAAARARSSSVPKAPFVSKREFAVFKDGREVSGKDKSGRDVRQRYRSMEDAQAAAKKVGGDARDMGLGENTEAWVTLALKRMIRWAAENGFDRVAWTTGEQQADRYDLRHHVKMIRAFNRDDGTFDFMLHPVSGGMRDLNAVPKDKLADHVGKELAAKIEQQKPKEWKSYEGLDLEIGGEGMLAFYDDVLPKIANRLLEKIGGEKVGTVRVNVPYSERDERLGVTVDTQGIEREPFEQPGFDITPAMREAAGKGLALFSRQTRKEGFPQGLGEPITTLERPYVAANLKRHPDYEAAKAGDHEAALRYVRDMVTEENIEEARRRFGADVIFVAPTAIEQSGPNAIPDTMAAHYASALGARMDTGIHQTNQVYHTGAEKLERLLARPVFDGPVERGASYVLVDDVITNGGTLAELADHIRAGGGVVKGVITLASASRTGKLSPPAAQIRNLERRLGDEIRELFHVEPAALTADEALTLEGIRNAEELRRVVGSARKARARRLSEAGISEPEDGVAGRPSAFSRAAIAGGPTTGDHRDSLSSSAMSYVRDLLHSDSRFGWWHKTIGTQQHKAMANRDFSRVYDEGQAFLGDVSKYANEAADLAADMLPRVDMDRGILKALGAKSPAKADLERAVEALYAGTLYGGGSPTEGRVWTDEELRSGRARSIGRTNMTVPAFEPLNDKQIVLYRQALASVGKSLDELAKSLIHRLARTHGIGFDREMSLEDVAQVVRDEIESQLMDLGAELEAMRDEDLQAQEDADYAESLDDGRPKWKIERAMAQFRAEREQKIAKAQAEYDALEELAEQVSDIEKKTTDLKTHGYFPAMRFGKFAVHVVRDVPGKTQPEQLYFGLYESQTKANLAVRELEREFPDARVERSIMSQEQHRLFQGLSLDALETFADYITGEDGQPIAKNPLVQGFLKAAVAERSSLKRHIHRKGIAGYSDDLPRVLANFTVSSARTTSSNYHSAEMLRLASEIRAGDVKDEAIKLARYLMDPQEEAQALRGFLFTQFLGGSIAHGLVNMTQPFMVTIPYLSQHTSAADAAAKVAAAAGTRPESLTGAIRDSYNRAKKEGVVAPQEIHQLRAETGGLPIAKNLMLRKLSFLWGSIYSITEQFNRGTTFLAAYRIAMEKGIPNPYAFAVNAVTETQFVYNKGNRPNWARGAFGATIFTFKQFSISYLELGKRLYKKDKKAFALMTLMLLAAAGIEGLPFAEDVEDLIDTVGQWMGYATNSKKSLRKWATAVLGKDMADIALHGISGFSWMPVDVSVRMGLQNLIPGTAMLKLSEKNKAQDVLEIVGPVGQFVPTEGTMAGRALERLAQADYFGALKAGAPVAAQNVAKGAEMLETGEARDTKGKRITSVSPGEAVLKMAGLQPATVARESRRVGEVTQDIDLQRRMEAEIAEQWARGLVDKRPEEVRSALKKLHDWNKENPELKVRVTLEQVRRRLKEMKTGREDRIIKRAAPEIRAGVREQLRQ